MFGASGLRCSFLGFRPFVFFFLRARGLQFWGLGSGFRFGLEGLEKGCTIIQSESGVGSGI